MVTDDELLRSAYLEHADNPMVQALAKRLEEALDDVDALNSALEKIENES